VYSIYILLGVQFGQAKKGDSDYALNCVLSVCIVLQDSIFNLEHIYSRNDHQKHFLRHFHTDFGSSKEILMEQYVFTSFPQITSLCKHWFQTIAVLFLYFYLRGPPESYRWQSVGNWQQLMATGGNHWQPLATIGNHWQLVATGGN
jgi:hypothetical protein